MVTNKGSSVVGLPLDVQLVQALRQGLEEGPISWLELFFEESFGGLYLFFLLSVILSMY